MDFAHEQQFTAKKAGGLGVVILAHVLFAGGLIYGLTTISIMKPKTDSIDVTPIPVKPFIPVNTTIKPVVHADNSINTKPIIPVDIFHTDTPVTPKEGNPVVTTGPVIDGPPSGGGGDVGGNTGTGSGSKISSPVITNLESCKPDYPHSAIVMEQEGVVRLNMQIGADGRLMSASVVKSSGYSVLDKAAVQGLSKCSFKAAIQNGTPVQSSLVTDYVWSLEH